MSLIGKEVAPFVTEAYQNGKFLTVNSDDLKGKWNVIVFYPADFSFVCPTELEDLQEQYSILKDLGVEEIKAQGEKFDPEMHEAVMRGQNPDMDDDTVEMVLEKGYKLYPYPRKTYHNDH